MLHVHTKCRNGNLHFEESQHTHSWNPLTKELFKYFFGVNSTIFWSGFTAKGCDP